jgi:hypothetical protein
VVERQKHRSTEAHCRVCRRQIDRLQMPDVNDRHAKAQVRHLKHVCKTLDDFAHGVTSQSLDHSGQPISVPVARVHLHKNIRHPDVNFHLSQKKGVAICNLQVRGLCVYCTNQVKQSCEAVVWCGVVLTDGTTLVAQIAPHHEEQSIRSFQAHVQSTSSTKYPVAHLSRCCRQRPTYCPHIKALKAALPL